MKLLISLIALAVTLSACGGQSDKPNIEPIRNMMVSPAYKAQDINPHTKKSSMLVPPKGTLAIGKKRYPYGIADFEKAGKELKNPLAQTVTREVLDRGQNRFEIYCGVCHGLTGDGKSSVAEKMPLRPPSLIDAKAKGLKDGYIYHVIYHGKGVMGSYANQIHTEEDRWAVVSYIRSLQKLAN